MRERGFIRTSLISLLVAGISFFTIYFFVPSMSLHYFGVAFSLRDGSVNQRVLQEAENLGYVAENPWELIQHLNNREGQLEAKRAWEEGGDAFKRFVSAWLDDLP